MSPTKHTSSLRHSPQAATLPSELSQEPPSPALTITLPGSHFQLQGALLWGQGPRPLPAKDQPWGGVLPRAQLSFPKCLGLFTSLPMCCWSWDIRTRAQPARTCLSCLHGGGNPALASLLLSPPCSPPFSGLGKFWGAFCVWLSFCTYVCGRMLPLSPPTVPRFP